MPRKPRSTREPLASPPAAPPRRIVVVGDLNGADDALAAILRGTRLVDANDRWIGGASELIQMGDVFNRGGGARNALARLRALRPQAKRAGGRVTMLLGNHEVMVALGNEAYCTEEEYLAFATAAERRAWPERVRRAMRRILNTHGPRGPVLPLEPRMDAWRTLNAPGRAAMRRALGPRGKLGRELRSLPITYQAEDAVFTHAGILPPWAALGVDGLNAAAKQAWKEAPRFYPELAKTGLFRHPDGPLWNRTLAMEGTLPLRLLVRSLRLLGARRMVVGHTQTSHVPGGTSGRILARYNGRLVFVDVGLRSGDPSSRAALIMENGAGYEWRPEGVRLLWRPPAGQR